MNLLSSCYSDNFTVDVIDVRCFTRLTKKDKNLIETKLYMNPTKNLIELKLYMNPTKNLIELKLYMNPTKNLIEP
jgi:hypothetical protein